MALSEVLVRVDALRAQQLVERIAGLSVFRIEPFDERAAIEVAIMTRNALDGGKKPAKRSSQATWAKLKYDRQIVAIALVTQATTIYSDDRDIRAIAKRAKVPVIGIADLVLPPEDAQKDLFVEQSAEATNAETNEDEIAPDTDNSGRPEAIEGVSGDGPGD